MFVYSYNKIYKEKTFFFPLRKTDFFFVFVKKEKKNYKVNDSCHITGNPPLYTSIDSNIYKFLSFNSTIYTLIYWKKANYISRWFFFFENLKPHNQVPRGFNNDRLITYRLSRTIIEIPNTPSEKLLGVEYIYYSKKILCYNNIYLKRWLN